MLHQYMRRVYSFRYVFHGISFTIDQSMRKIKIKMMMIAHYSLYHSSLAMC